MDKPIKPKNTAKKINHSGLANQQKLNAQKNQEESRKKKQAQEAQPLTAQAAFGEKRNRVDR